MNSDKATKIFFVVFLVACVIGLAYALITLYKLERRYDNIDTKISSVELLQKSYEESLDQKIDNIKKTQSANDKKLKEVSNAAFRKNYQMSDDDVIAGWDNFMSDIYKRNSSRNIDK